MKKDNVMSKAILRSTLTLALCAMPLIGFSMDGNGSSGGGQSKNGFLRDLEAMSSLDCGPARDTANTLESWGKIKETISKYHYTFAKQIDKELNKATICFSGEPLSETIIPNQDGIIKPQTAYSQAAIRVENGDKIEVYVDQKEWDQMDDDHKGFLLLHEVSHSFIEKTPTQTYINRLRFFVGSIYKLYNGATSTVSKFEQMKQMASVRYADVDASFKYVDSVDDINGLLPQIAGDRSKLFINTLSKAMLRGDLSVTERLIELGVDVNGEMENGLLVICSAVTGRKYRESLKLLVDHGVNINTVCPTIDGSYGLVVVLMLKNYELEEGDLQLFRTFLELGIINVNGVEMALKQVIKIHKVHGNYYSKEMIKVLRKYLGRSSWFD